MSGLAMRSNFGLIRRAKGIAKNGTEVSLGAGSAFGLQTSRNGDAKAIFLSCFWCFSWFQPRLSRRKDFVTLCVQDDFLSLPQSEIG